MEIDTDLIRQSLIYQNRAAGYSSRDSELLSVIKAVDSQLIVVFIKIGKIEAGSI